MYFGCCFLNFLELINMASLNSPKSKLNRAREQRDALNRDISALCDFSSYIIAKDIDNATGNQVYSFKSVPPMPDDIGLRIGEMLYNYRCSLDHLIWQLVLPRGILPQLATNFLSTLFLANTNVTRRESSKGSAPQ